MSACGRFQDWMVEGLYRELDSARQHEFEQHLADCPACAALYGDLRATVDTMHRRRRPDPGAKFWDEYWGRLEERVAREASVVDASRSGRRRLPGSWGFRVAAAVLVLAAGVWIGRTVLAPAPRTADPQPEMVVVTPPAENGAAPDGAAPPREPAAAGDEVADAAPSRQAIDAPAEPAREAAPETGTGVAAAAGTSDDALRYIGRSQVLLVALLNGAADGDGQAGGFGSERAQARVLLAEGGRIRDDLTRPEDRRLRELMAQLELILREIANLEAESDVEAVEMIRNRVDREGVLLRIDLQQMRNAGDPDGRAAEPQKAFD